MSQRIRKHKLKRQSLIIGERVETEHKELTKHAGKASFGTILSRILGFARDMFVAQHFGAGMAADAFYAAFRVPNLLRRLLGEGSFNGAFIPVFSEYLHTRDKEEVQKMLNAVFTAFAILLIVITLLGIVFSPAIVKIISWGFSSNPEKMKLTIELTRLMFPFIFFISLAAFLLAILNTLKSFFIPAFAPAMLSISQIVYMLAVIPLFTPDDPVKGLSIAVVVGGFLHFISQYPNLRKLGWHLKFRINFKHPAIKQIAFLMLPAVIGLSVDQINAFVDNICASFLPSGSITALYYSNRVMQLPLAIFGLALASVSLPAMSKARAQNDIKTLKSSLNYSIRFSVFSLLPSAIGLMVIGLPIIRLLFERGRFDLAASMMTNDAMFYYSLGLPAYAMAKIFANGFYAFQDTRTPVKTAAAAMVLHVILCVTLMRPMGVGGLALATALSSYFNMALLVFFLRKKIGKIGFKKILFSGIKTLIASAALGAVAYYTAGMHHRLFITVPVAIICALAAFFIVSKILKSEELQVFERIFKKNEQIS